MVTIYSSFTSPRLSYILDFVFEEVLRINYEVITNIKDSKEIHIWYASDKNQSTGIQIHPSALLNERRIRDVEVNYHQAGNELPQLFFNSSGDDSFDLFAQKNIFLGCSNFFFVNMDFFVLLQRA